MPLRLYTDTHIAKQVAIQLRRRGVDVVRCEEVGLATASDGVHLQYAAEHGLAIVTQDDDFSTLHALWQTMGYHHAGIFYLSSSVQGEAQISVLVRSLLEYAELVNSGAATVEDDIIDHLYFL